MVQVQQGAMIFQYIQFSATQNLRRAATNCRAYLHRELMLNLVSLSPSFRKNGPRSVLYIFHTTYESRRKIE
jgi:hypothetical protein